MSLMTSTDTLKLNLYRAILYSSAVSLPGYHRFFRDTFGVCYNTLMKFPTENEAELRGCLLHMQQQYLDDHEAYRPPFYAEYHEYSHFLATAISEVLTETHI